MFFVLVIVVLGGVLFGITFITRKTANFPVIRHLAKGRRLPALIISLLIYAMVYLLLFRTINGVNTVIAFAHLTVIWLLSELIFFVIRKASGRQLQLKPYYAGVCAIVFCVIYLIGAWYNCLNVRETHYTLKSDKLAAASSSEENDDPTEASSSEENDDPTEASSSEENDDSTEASHTEKNTSNETARSTDSPGRSRPLRIVQISDSHMGATFHADGLLKYVKEINSLKPDAVMFTGDFVDDDTSRADLIGSCKALGQLKTTYGVYFCFGNHDKGYFNPESRGWTVDDLRKNLTENHVVILEDEARLIDDRFYVVGRQDASVEYQSESRAKAETLTADLDKSRYIIMLDHQPNDYDAEARAGADLVLSGHTHGGQFFPFNRIGELFQQYERAYGYERRGTTDFIVSSGISDWTLIFKTGCRSEYVVIDINA